MKNKVVVEFNREESLVCVIALEGVKKPYKWQKDALAKLNKARKVEL